ncbi:MAG TPA: 1-phosphofructokinase family hexose kinase [Phycisphaerae bacterium]|mgnify:CR=1 FL=1|nr:1-phosphofructokinase family hexose kinase [Phycisphaerae bacterium]HRR85289.1 1-phosphofructokinase family hexose kinase [Phycisphaerae bacterium]
MSLPVVRSVVTVTLNPTIDRIIEVPDFRVGAHLRGRMRSLLPAGKAINVSRAMAALGSPSTAAGWVGAESLALFEDALRQAGVAVRLTPITGATRENITIVDPVGHTETHIRDTGPTVTQDDIQQLTTELTTLSNPDCLLVFTGSCAPGLDASRFVQLLRACMDGGAHVVVDSSGDHLREAAKLPLWLLKPNLFELGELLGFQISHESEVIEAGRRLNEHIPLVLVTMGERGAMCFAEGRVFKGRAPVPPDSVRSTVGCGDAMLAGFLAATTRPDWQVENAFRQALAVSAASAMTDQPAVFQACDVNQLLQDSEIADVRLGGG